MNFRKHRIIILLFFFCLIVPLGAQTQGDYDDEDDFWDDEWLLMEGGGLTVVGTTSTTQQIEIIDRETIEKAHAADLPALLEETIDLVVIRYGPYGNQADLNLRGFDLNRVAILVDGVPVNSAASGDFDFYSIDPNSIERIEVIHGGSDTKFNVSGALGGVINIVTVKKPESGWSVGGVISNTSYLPGKYITQSRETGSPQWQDLLDTQSVNVFGSYGTERFNIRANAFANSAENHFLYTSYNGLTRRKEGNEILDGGANASFIWQFQDLSKLIASGAFYMGNKNIPTGGYSFVHAEQKDRSTRANLMLEMPRAFHDDLSMELSLGHIWKNMFYDPGRETSLHNEHSLDLINRWGWYPSSAFTLRFGGDYRFIHLDSTDTLFRTGHRAGLYLTSEFNPVKKFLLIASIKGMTDTLGIIPVPKFGFAWTISDYLTLKNNYFRSFKFPDFNDLYWVQGGFRGNPDLKNEDGWGADLSVEISSGDLLTASSTFYGQWIDNSIHWSSISGTWRPENSGTATFMGLDNKLYLVLPFSIGFIEKPAIGLSYLFQLSWLLNDDLKFSDSRRIPYMPMHTIGTSLSLPWKIGEKKLQGSLAVSGHFESSRFTETGNIIKLDPCFLLNIIYNQELSKSIGIFGKLNNVLNTSYVSFADYPMPGINLTLGMNMNFKGNGK